MPETIFQSLLRIFTPFGEEMYHEGDRGQSRDVKWQTHLSMAR